MTNEEWQRWWDGEWQRQRAIIQKWQPSQRPNIPLGEKWWQLTPEERQERLGNMTPHEKEAFQDWRHMTELRYVGRNKFECYRKDAEQARAHQAPPAPPTLYLEPKGPEMRDQMIGAPPSLTDADNAKVARAVGNGIGTVIGWAIGLPILCLLGLLAFGPFIGFIAIVLLVVPIPVLIIALILWLAGAADYSLTRSAIRKELERRDKRKGVMQ